MTFFLQKIVESTTETYYCTFFHLPSIFHVGNLLYDEYAGRGKKNTGFPILARNSEAVYNGCQLTK